jgi:hypothetical protein
MARIKKYPINFDIHPKDIVIGTDRIDFDKTKNFRMETLKEFFTTDVDFGQNNLVREYFIGFAQDKTELNNILDNINLTVSEDENVIVTYFTPSPSNANLWVQAMLWWKKGKGVYNPIGSTDFTGKFLQLPIVSPTEDNVNELITAPNAIVHDYGTIAVPAWLAINNASPAVDYSDATKIYYVKTRSNDIDYLFVFNGANGFYGDGELQAIDDDLVLLFSSSGISVTSGGAEDLTYSELVDRINNSALIKGSYYRITDFQTVHKILGGTDVNTGSVEPIIVLATKQNQIDSLVFSELFPNDILHYKVLDDTIMAPSSGSKGVILYRKDTQKNLSCYYDFRNVVFRRWATNPFPGLYIAYSIYSGINAFIEEKTFGQNARDIEIGSNSFNIVIRNNCYAINIGSNVGIAGAGVTIGNNSHGIIIEDDCCQVVTLGGGNVGGIYIGSDCVYIKIGMRSYNIAIGFNCYAIDLGLQNNDVFIPDNTIRRRLEKGFSNFECTQVITGLNTINPYSVTLNVLTGILFGSGQYCGIINVTSANASEDIEVLDALLTSISFHDIRIIPENGLVLNFIDKLNSTNPDKNLNLGGSNISIDGSKGEYIQFHKRMENTFGLQTSDFYLSYTNKPTEFDQDNLPIKIDLTLADLGLTEIGTDEEMNTAIKAYFTANNLTVDQKQIPHIRLFDELEDLPDFRFTVDDLDAFWSIAETDFFGESRDINNLENWIELFEILASGFNYPEFFSSFNINGNTVSFFGFNEELSETFINFIAFTDVLFLNVLINCRIEQFQISTNNNCEFDFKVAISQIGILGITHTIEEFDNQLLFWSQNIAQSTGVKVLFLQSVNDLSGSQTILELQNKDWDITIF